MSAAGAASLHAMPKLLVLYEGRSPALAALAALADAVAEGARGVRFTEVEVRRVGGSTDPGDTPHQPFDPSVRIEAHDAIVLGADADVAPLDAALAAIARAHLHDPVGAAFTLPGGDPWPLLQALGPRFLVVPPRPDGDAAKLGARVATVMGWVRHVKAHHHH